MNQETNGFPSGTGGVTTTSTATYPDGRKTFAAANNAGIAIIYGFGGTTAAAPNGGYRVQHVSSAIASAPVTLQVVLPLETSGDPISNPTGATNAINITGSLTKQTYFEDDIPEYAGVTVEGSYVGIRDSTDSAVANNSSYATLTGTPFTNGNEFFKEKYWTMNIARVRRPITLSRLYLDVTYNSTRTPGWNAPNNHQPNWEPGAYEGINVDGKEIVIQIAGQRYFLPFTNWNTIRYVSQASIGTLGKYLQYDTTDIDWEEELFDKGGLKLTVNYAGTTETKEIGYTEWMRAKNRGQAVVVVEPNLFQEDLDTVVARFGYFSKQVSDPTIDAETFPNQVVDVVVPVYEFEGEMAFVLKENMPNVPLQIHGRNAARTWRDEPLSEGTINAIAATYDLVAYYSRAGDRVEKKMNSLLNGGDDATNKVASWQDRWSSTGAVGSAATAKGEPQPPAAGSVMNPAWGNQTAEIVDLDLMFRMPSKTSGAYTDLSDNYWVATTDATFDGIVIGDDNTASLPNSITGTRRETTVRQAFLGLTAELPTVQCVGKFKFFLFRVVYIYRF